MGINAMKMMQDDEYYPDSIILKKDFKLHCAHHLVDQGGKCVNVHGHTYHIEVVIEGLVSTKNNMLIDTYILDKIIVEPHDHKNLNETLNTNNPTMEFMAMKLMQNLKCELQEYLINFIELTIWETENSRVTLAEVLL